MKTTEKSFLLYTENKDVKYKIRAVYRRTKKIFKARRGFEMSKDSGSFLLFQCIIIVSIKGKIK